jgi:hypothetical protein
MSTRRLAPEAFAEKVSFLTSNSFVQLIWAFIITIF